jgi:hypothetical protein
MVSVKRKDRLQALAQEKILLLQIRYRRVGISAVAGEGWRDAALDEGREAEVGDG